MLEKMNFKVGSEFEAKGSDGKFYKATVERLTQYIAYIKTEDPKDNSITRMVTIPMCYNYFEQGFWRNVVKKQPKPKTRKIKQISQSVIIHYWVEQGLTNKEIQEKLPNANKSTVAAAASEARNNPEWRQRNVRKYEEYMLQIKKSHSSKTGEA